MHPFRFGVTASHARTGEAWRTLAQRAEELGYSSLLVPDHLTGQLSPISAIATAAAVTTRLRVGGFVFANDFRHPLILAREAATLDLLSNGRLELGLGAGWRTGDYRQLGMPYDAPGRRIDRLVEAIGIVKRLLAGETVNQDGPNFHLGDASVLPRPVQRPHPPIIMGGGGPRMLRLAAREADIVGFIPAVQPSRTTDPDRCHRSGTRPQGGARSRGRGRPIRTAGAQPVHRGCRNGGAGRIGPRVNAHRDEMGGDRGCRQSVRAVRHIGEATGDAGTAA